MAPIRFISAISAGLMLAGLVLLPNPSAGQGSDEPVVVNKGIVKEPAIEILKRGPVHEAFAQPFDADAAVPPVVEREPPPPVPELPPEQRPEGDNVQWIPGYWAWDPERKDFTWVSGTYRDLPPGRQFLPGYWTHTEEGWRWVPGYFAPEQQADAPQYVPARPPASLEVGPSVPPPDNNSFYAPGCWAYNNGDYLWRPGYWAPMRPGWLWFNPGYCWTPRGWLFRNGYWDYPFERRGLLFAPVAFGGPWRSGWAFRPRFVVAGLLNGLFARQGFPSYYYGGFGGNYARHGFRPWFAGPARFDPALSYYRWQNRDNPGWLAGLQENYRNGGLGPNGQNLQTVTPLTQLRNPNVRLTQLSPNQIDQQRANAQAFRQVAQQRSKVETRRSIATRGNSGAATGKVANPGTGPNSAGPQSGPAPGKIGTSNSYNRSSPSTSKQVSSYYPRTESSARSAPSYSQPRGSYRSSGPSTSSDGSGRAYSRSSGGSTRRGGSSSGAGRGGGSRGGGRR